MDLRQACGVLVRGVLVCYFVYRVIEAVGKLQERNIGTSFQTVHVVNVEESNHTSHTYVITKFRNFRLTSSLNSCISLQYPALTACLQCASKWTCAFSGRSFSETDELDDIISRYIYYYRPSNGYKYKVAGALWIVIICHRIWSILVGYCASRMGHFRPHVSTAWCKNNFPLFEIPASFLPSKMASPCTANWP